MPFSSPEAHQPRAGGVGDVCDESRRRGGTRFRSSGQVEDEPAVDSPESQPSFVRGLFHRGNVLEQPKHFVDREVRGDGQARDGAEAVLWILVFWLILLREREFFSG